MIKNWKKRLSVLLSVVMAFSMNTTAFAVENPDGDAPQAWIVSCDETVSDMSCQYDAGSCTLSIEAGGTGDIYIEANSLDHVYQGMELDLESVSGPSVRVRANEELSVFVDGETDMFNDVSMDPQLVDTGDVLYAVNADPKSIQGFSGDEMVTIPGAVSVISSNMVGDPDHPAVDTQAGEFNGYAMASYDEETPILVKLWDDNYEYYEQYKLAPRLSNEYRDENAVVESVKDWDHINTISVTSSLPANEYSLFPSDGVPTQVPDDAACVGEKDKPAKSVYDIVNLDPAKTYYVASRAVRDGYFSTPWYIYETGVKPFRDAPWELKSVTVDAASVRGESFTLSVNQQQDEKDIKYLVVREGSDADKALADGNYVGSPADWSPTTSGKDVVTKAAVSAKESGISYENVAPGKNYVVYAVYVDGDVFNSLPTNTGIRVNTSEISDVTATLTVTPASAEYAGRGECISNIFKFEDKFTNANNDPVSDEFISTRYYAIVSENGIFMGDIDATYEANTPLFWTSDYENLPVGKYKAKAYYIVDDSYYNIKNKTLSSNVVDIEVTRAKITPKVSVNMWDYGNLNMPGYLYATGLEPMIVEKGKLEYSALLGELLGLKYEDNEYVSFPGDLSFTVKQGNSTAVLSAGNPTYDVLPYASGDTITVSFSEGSDELRGYAAGSYEKQESQSLTIRVIKNIPPVVVKKTDKELTISYLRSWNHLAFIEDASEFVEVTQDGEDITKKGVTLKIFAGVDNETGKDMYIDLTEDNIEIIGSLFEDPKVGDKFYLTADYAGMDSTTPPVELTVQKQPITFKLTDETVFKTDALADKYNTSYDKTFDVYALNARGEFFVEPEDGDVKISDWTTNTSGAINLSKESREELAIKVKQNLYSNYSMKVTFENLTLSENKAGEYVIQNPVTADYTIVPRMTVGMRLATVKSVSANIIAPKIGAREASRLELDVTTAQIARIFPEVKNVPADKVYRDITWYAYVTDENGNVFKVPLSAGDGKDCDVHYEKNTGTFSMDLADQVRKYTPIEKTAEVMVYVTVIDRAKQPYDVERSDTKLTFHPISTVVYNGMQHVSSKAALKKNQVGDLDIVITSGDYELKEGVDYKVKYKNNVYAGSYENPAGGAKEAKAPKVIINGLGQYKGMYFEQYFIIEPAELSDITVTGLYTYYKLDKIDRYRPKFTGYIGPKKISAKNLFARFEDGTAGMPGDVTANKSGTKLTGKAGEKVKVTFSTDDPNFAEGSTYEYTFNDGTPFEAILVPSTARKLGVKLGTTKVNYSAEGFEASDFNPNVTVKNGKSKVTLEAGTGYEAKLYLKESKGYIPLDEKVKDSGNYYVGVRPTEETILGRTVSGLFVDDTITYKAVKIIGKKFTSQEKKGFITKYKGEVKSTKSGQHIAIEDPGKGYDIELMPPALDNPVRYVAYDVTGKNIVAAGEVSSNGAVIKASDHGEYNRTPGTYRIDIYGLGAYDTKSKTTIKYMVDPIPADKVSVLVYDDEGSCSGNEIMYNIGGYVYSEEGTDSAFGKVKLGLKAGGSEDAYLSGLLKDAKVTITGSKIGEGKITITNVKADGKAVIKGAIKWEVEIVPNNLSVRSKSVSTNAVSANGVSANSVSGNEGIRLVDTGITAKKMNGNAQKGENFLKLYQASAKLGIDDQGNFKTKILRKNTDYSFTPGQDFATKGVRQAGFTGKDHFTGIRTEDVVIAEDLFTANKDLKMIKVNGGQSVIKVDKDFDAPVYPDVTVGSYTMTWNGSEYVLKGNAAPSGYKIRVTIGNNIYVGNKAFVNVSFIPVADGYSYTGSKTVKFNIKAAK